MNNALKRLFLDNVEQATQTSDHVCCGRCPVCGDSKKSSKKKRLYLLLDPGGGVAKIYCHNCFYSSIAPKFFKTYFPSAWRLSLSSLQTMREDRPPPVSIYAEDDDDEVSWKPQRDAFFSKCCFKLLSKQESREKSRLQHIAVRLCKRRRIPDRFVNEFHVCFTGMYRNRLIIPFFNKEEEVYFFQARDLTNSTSLRYLSKDFAQYDVPAIYRRWSVDPSKHVIVCEGLIDSMYFSNAVALCRASAGGRVLQILGDSFSERTFVFDNDPTGKQKTKELLLRDERCFIWPPEFADYKDIGELIEHGIGVDESLIIRNSYRGVPGVVRMA